LRDCAPFLEGILIPVKHLIDGAAIVTVACEEVGCCHVELPAGMLAEQLAAESYPEGILGISPSGGGSGGAVSRFGRAALRRARW
jgi:hypothetical protein